MTLNLVQGQKPTTTSWMDAVVRRMEQFGTGGQYAPATPNPWRSVVGGVKPIQQEQLTTPRVRGI